VCVSPKGPRIYDKNFKKKVIKGQLKSTGAAVGRAKPKPKPKQVAKEKVSPAAKDNDSIMVDSMNIIHFAIEDVVEEAVNHSLTDRMLNTALVFGMEGKVTVDALPEPKGQKTTKPTPATKGTKEATVEISTYGRPAEFKIQ